MFIFILKENVESEIRPNGGNDVVAGEDRVRGEGGTADLASSERHLLYVLENKS